MFDIKRGVEVLRQNVKIAPEAPGVYRMLDEKDEVLYVGKAKNLKKRVYSYFNKHHDSPKLRVMVPQIEKIQFIVTDSEVEALILESHLIKKHKPRRFTVLFKREIIPYRRIQTAHFQRLSHHAHHPQIIVAVRLVIL